MYAVQVLSVSMSAAIRSAIDTKEMKSPTAAATASFIEMINNCFDAMNSKTVYSKQYNNGALSENNPYPFKALDKAYATMTQLQKERMDKKSEKKLIYRPHCFDGYLLTISAIKNVYKCQKSKGYPFLLTARLNQDILENQSSIYRQHGGYARNPTVRNFEAAFKSNSVMNLMKAPKTSSYETDVQSENLLDIGVNVEVNEDISEDSNAQPSTSSNSSPDRSDQATLEDCAVVYFAGYLARRCMDKFKCDCCTTTLASSDNLTNSTDILLFYKNYNINNPTALKKTVRITKKIYRTIYETCGKIYSQVLDK